MRGRAAFGDAAAAVWLPTDAELDRSRLKKAMTRWGFQSLEDLHARAVNDPDWFWPAAIEDLGLPLRGDYASVCDQARGRELPRWFSGATINVVDACVERHANDPALADAPAVIFEGDGGQCRSLTFAQLKREVDLFAGALKRLGVAAGDRIALFMPPVPEAAVAVLGAAKIGAVVVPAFSGYGAEPLAARLNAAEVSVLVVADGTTRRGSRVPMKEIADGAAALSPSVRSIIVISNSGEEVPMSEGRDHRWEDLRNGSPDTEAPAALDPNHPLFIIYTSGTTGAPKGIVHSHIGYLLKSNIDLGYAFDLQPGDRLGWITDMGWMLGPLMIIGGLGCGSGLVMIEGLPTYPAQDRIWQIVERHRVTVLGVAPTAARGLRTVMGETPPSADLSSLRAFASTGEAWDLPTWQWLFEIVGRSRLPILNYTGGTETGGGILSGYTIAPMAPASFSGPLLGMDVDVLDADARSTQEIGELVMLNTWPGMAHGFWRDEARYISTYFSRWPETWVHGDLASIDAHGYWHIHGRSDDTLKIGGRRVGPAEIESGLVALEGVAEAAVIGVSDPVRGQKAVAFVTPRGDLALNEAKLLADVTKAIGKGMAPSAIHVVTGLPKTRNGKIMRRAIRSRYLGEPAGDMSSLDPSIPLDVIPVLEKS